MKSQIKHNYFKKGQFMIIQIDKKHSIESDIHCWVVREKTKSKKEYKHIGFYSTLESAIKNFVELKIRMIKSNNLNKILSEIQKIRKDMNKVLKPFDISIK